MSDDVPKPPAPSLPAVRDFEAALTRLSQVIRSHTHAIKLVDAKEVANAKLLSDLLALSGSLRDSSAAAADRVSGKVDVLIDLARDSRTDLRAALSELRAANDRLGVTRDEIAQLKLSDRFTPTSVPLPREETRDSPPDGISVRHGKIRASFGLAEVWSGVKRFGPAVGWISGAATAAWHAFRHFLGH